MLSMLRTIIYDLDNHLEVRCSTSHFIALIFAPHSFHKSEETAKHILLKRITSILTVIILLEWALLHIITGLFNRTHPIIFINRMWTATRITSVQFSEATKKFIDQSEPKKTPQSKNTVCTRFHRNHQIKWHVKPIIQSVVKLEIRQISSSRISFTTPNFRMPIFHRSSSELLRVSSSIFDCIASNLYMLGTVLKCTRRFAGNISSAFSASAKEAPTIRVNRT